MIGIFLAMVVPLFLLGLEVAIRGEASVRREIVGSMSTQLVYSIELIETAILSIRSLQNQLVNDIDIRKLAFLFSILEPYDRVAAILSVDRSLRLLNELSRYVRDTRIYLPEIRRALSAKDPILAAMTEADGSFVMKVLASHNGIVLADEGQLYFSVVYPSMSSEAPVFGGFIVSVQLDVDELIHDLEGFVGHANGEALLIDRSGSWSVGTAGASDVAQLLTDHLDATETVGYRTLETDETTYITVHAYSSVLDANMVYLYPEEIALGVPRRYRVHVWVLAAATIGIIIGFARWMRVLVARPLDQLVNAFRKLEGDKLTVSIDFKRNDDFGYLYEQFNRMVRRLKQTMELAVEEKVLIQQAELRQLQYQINPHFLYNGFFLLHRMAVAEDLPNVVRLSDCLRQYYQFITASDSGLIRLRDELAHLRNYIEIQSLRFGHRVRVDMPSVDANLLDLMVPRLIAQPVVENAFEHGLKDVSENGKICVSIERAGPALVISVADNGSVDAATVSDLQSYLDSGRHGQRRSEPNGTEAGQRRGRGLANIQRRLSIRYGGTSGIMLSRSNLGGLRVEIRIAIAGIKDDKQTPHC